MVYMVRLRDVGVGVQLLRQGVVPRIPGKQSGVSQDVVDLLPGDIVRFALVHLTEGPKKYK